MVKSTYISKWNNELNIENEVNWWHKVNQSIVKLKDKKLAWLQYRIIHRIIGTKKYIG